MRIITLLIIHCSATLEGKDYTVADIEQWHRSRGFATIGYHYVIYRDGTIHEGRPENVVGAHCKGHNDHSIGICYIGGLANEHQPKHSDSLSVVSSREPASSCKMVPRDTRTPEQKASLLTLLKQLKHRYPHAIITSHHTFDPQKACPCFDADSEYLELSNWSPS